MFVVDDRVGDQPGAFVPDLLLRFGFHAELAGVDVGDSSPHPVGLAAIERFLNAPAQAGRINKNINTLNFIEDKMRRRSTPSNSTSAKAGTACHEMSFMESEVNFTYAAAKARRIS